MTQNASMNAQIKIVKRAETVGASSRRVTAVDQAESMMRLNISIFRQIAKLRPDLVREEFEKIRRK